MSTDPPELIPKRMKPLTERRFSRLVVLGVARHVKSQWYWKCQCDCGNITEVRTSSLVGGGTVSCGCVKAYRSGPGEFLNGQVFGRLTVLDDPPVWNRKGYKWRCRCECGTASLVSANSLKKGTTRSCGCLHLETVKTIRRTHGRSRSRTYIVWIGMKERCLNPNNPNFKNYGGRGIKVYERWLKFENFLSDMGQRPAGKSIDRINNDGNYEPGNCRWATVVQQLRNTRRSRMLEFNGLRLALPYWAERVGLSQKILTWRINNGWEVSRALTTPAMVDAESRKHRKQRRVA